MTVSSTNTKNSYSGDGSVTVFAYTFKIFDDDDISVIIRTDATGTETVQTKNTHYSVSGVGDAGGGNITFVTAPAVGETVVLIRQTVQTQTTDYTPNDPFPAESHENALDKLTLIIQDVQEEVDRSIKLSRTNTMTSTEFTVGSSDRADKVLAFDSSGELSVAQELGVYRGAWTSGTAFAVRDLIKDTTNNNIYICQNAHTSSGSLPISTNANASDWELIVDAATATTSATAAAASATAAAASETAAAASETAAAASETAAAASETAAATSETNAASSASTASTAATNAATSETNAATSETNAATSATAAASSATSAASSASTATTKASEASTSATNAATSASSASSSATAASTSASNAATSETNAATSATSAASSASSASTSASNAATSETNASTSETNAASSATSAASSATSAASSASAASTSETNAATSASNASTSETNAATSETNAATSATNAASSATSAASSASSASSAQTAAESARDATLAAYDNFDDRYLGAKTSDPTLDNDGNALVAGSLYFNTTSGAMKVYTGSAWVAAYVSGTDYLALSGGTMTGNVSFGDNDKATFGDAVGGDLQIYHDGTDSVIKDTGTGNLVITSNGGGIFFRNNEETETYANFNNNGSVQLRYDNSPKLETTSSGIDVQGSVTADGLTVDGGATINAANAYLAFTETDTTNLNTIIRNNGGQFKIQSATDVLGATERVLLDHATGDISFYDSTGVTQGLFWDASTQRLGLGTTVPTVLMHLKQSSGNAILRLNSDTGEKRVDFGNTTDDDAGRIKYDSGGFSFWTNGTRRFEISETSYHRIIGQGDGYAYLEMDTNTADKGQWRFQVDSNPAVAKFYLQDYSGGAWNTNLTVDQNGQVGIGMTPTQKLEVNGGIALQSTQLLRWNNAGTITGSIAADNSNNLLFYNGSANTERMRIDSSGNLLVGKTSVDYTTVGFEATPSSIFQANAMTADGKKALLLARKTSDGDVLEFRKNSTAVGSISVTGSGTTYNTTSDIRLKTDIAPIADATDKLMAMNAVSHKWKSDPDADAVVGFIAQEMAEIVPEAVNKGEGEDDMWSMDYGRITPVLVAALQDAVNEIKTLKERVAELEAK